MIHLLTGFAAYYLEERVNALFDPSDSRSLDLHHSARLLLPANS